MYGGGFSTVPAYLADLFGTRFVGAIHGRLLTAWATAGILGPVVVNYMRDYQLGMDLPRAQVYNQTMYILVGMLALGLLCNLLCNLLVRPLHSKYFMSDAEIAEEDRLIKTTQPGSLAQESAASQPLPPQAPGNPAIVYLAWLAVGVPLCWGIWRTAVSVSALF